MNKKRKRTLTRLEITKAIIFLGIVAIFICGGMFWLVDGLRASDVAYSFMGHIYSERYDSAFELLSSELKTQTIDASYLQKFVQENDAKPYEWWINLDSNMDRSGINTGNVTLDDGNTVALTLQLIFENGNWYVGSFEWGTLNSNDL